MIVLYGPTQLAHIPNPDIRNLVLKRFKQILDGDIYDYDLHGYMIVMEPADTVEALEQETQCSILHNFSDGTYYGHPDFTPSFEALEEHTNCYEMVFILSDGGFGIELFIPKSKDINSELISMCAEYAVPESKKPFQSIPEVNMQEPLNELVADITKLFDSNLREDFEERAGIMEFDGNLPRAHAECLALIDVLSRYPNVLSGVRAMHFELNGETQWLLTTDIELSRKRLIELGGFEIDTPNLFEVINQDFEGTAMLTTARFALF